MAKKLKLSNYQLKSGQQAMIFEKPGIIANPGMIPVDVPAEDVMAVHIVKK